MGKGNMHGRTGVSRDKLLEKITKAMNEEPSIPLKKLATKVGCSCATISHIYHKIKLQKGGLQDDRVNLR